MGKAINSRNMRANRLGRVSSYQKRPLMRRSTTSVGAIEDQAMLTPTARSFPWITSMHACSGQNIKTSMHDDQYSLLVQNGCSASTRIRRHVSILPYSVSPIHTNISIILYTILHIPGILFYKPIPDAFYKTQLFLRVNA